MTKPHIVVVEDFILSDQQVQRLESIGDVTFYDTQAATDEEWLERVETADVICSGFSKLKTSWKDVSDVYVSVPFVGVDFIDTDIASSNGVSVSNSPGCNKYAVSEWTVGMMVNLSRSLLSRVNTSENTAGKVGQDNPLGLAGKSVCVLGKGSVGSAIGQALEGMQMQVSYFGRGENLADCVNDADYVINALSLNSSTKGMLNSDFFQSMKPGSIFLSVSRSETEDIDALIAELDDGRIALAAHDNGSAGSGNTESELYLKLKDHPKISVTPHIAFNSDVSDKNCNDTMIANVEAWVAGDPQNILGS